MDTPKWRLLCVGHRRYCTLLKLNMQMKILIGKLAIAGFMALFTTNSMGDGASIHIVHGNKNGYPYEYSVDVSEGEYFSVVCQGACFLKKANVEVTGAKVNGYEGATDGYVVKVTNPESSLFLVKGLGNLREGPIRTWYYNDKFQKSAEDTTVADFSKKQEISWQVGDKRLSIAGAVAYVKDQTCTPNDTDCPKYPKITWKFRFGEVERTLFTLGGSELEYPLGIQDFIVWVGDLDGDGKPDLVVRPQGRSDYLELSLFLSSALSPGKPWRPSAKFYWWDPTNPGC